MVFVYEWKLRWLPSSKDNAHDNIIYKKPNTFQKLHNSRYVFIYTKPYTWRHGIFMKFLKLAFIYKKTWPFSLRDVFIYKNHDTSQKARQIALRFYIQNPDTLRYAVLLKFLNWRRGWDIFICKKRCTFRYVFYIYNLSYSTDTYL